MGDGIDYSRDNMFNHNKVYGPIKQPGGASIEDKLDNEAFVKEIVKYKDGKLQWNLLPWEAIRFIIPAFEHGLKKYGRRYSFKDGIPYLDLFDALMRHITDWLDIDKPDEDEESKLPTLAHVGADILMLITMTLLNQKMDGKLDDR